MAKIKKQLGCTDPDCGCEPPACCICVDCAEVDCYQIKDYDASIFEGSVNCETAGGGTEWDGTFTLDTSGAFNGLGCRAWTNGDADRLNGFCMDEEGSGKAFVLVNYGCCWYIVLWSCTFGGGSRNALWAGCKDGYSPLGIYTRTDDEQFANGVVCSPGPATLEIEACPGAAAISTPTCYRLAGYSDGDLDASGCTNCEDGGPGGEWDGRFSDYTSICNWIANGAGGGVVVSGKVAANPEVLVGFSTLECLWRLSIRCQGSSPRTIWEGTKITGMTPAGSYTRVSGCDATSTLTVEVCP